jgi:glycosyltransferase involved in cell wall biosynthesis
VRRVQERPLRILLVNANGADVSAGGAERYTADLAAGLLARGHEVKLLAAAPSRAVTVDVPTTVLHHADWRDSIGRRVANRAADFRASPSPGLEQAVRTAAPDVVHTGTLPGITTAVWEVAAGTAIPVVHTLHDYYLLCARTTLTRRDGSPCATDGKYCAFRSRRLLRHGRFVSQLIGVSEHMVDMHRAVLPGAETHVVRHPLGSTPARPAHMPPRSLGYIGRLEREKGVEVLIEAAEQLHAQGITVRIAGAGSLRPALERTPVEYAGVVEGDAKQRFLESCDAGVVPSLWLEPGGPPYSVLEWLSTGRPVLVSVRGGLVEAPDLFGGVRGFEPTPEALVAAFQQLGYEAVPEPRDGQADRARWLDDHERIYELA